MGVTKGLTLLVALAVSSIALADTLLIDGVSSDAASASDRPRRGMTMDAVEARYGAPAARVAPVGDPPISRWEYPGFIVYFEYDHVIHAAVRH
jgi:hypothetical protein